MLAVSDRIDTACPAPNELADVAPAAAPARFGSKAETPRPEPFSRADWCRAAAILTTCIAIGLLLAAALKVPVSSNHVTSAGVQELRDTATPRTTGTILFPYVSYATPQVLDVIRADLGIASPPFSVRERHTVAGREQVAQDAELSLDEAWRSATIWLGADEPTNRALWVADAGPVAGLRAGDWVVQADRRAGRELDNIAGQLHDPHETTHLLRVKRGDETFTVEATNHQLAQVSLDERSLTRPDRPEVLVENMQGSSLSLAATLVYLQSLTGLDLTAGLTVAATGDIGWYGAVGRIGSIAAKARAVRAADADVFFVPDYQAHEAKRAAPGLNVVAVTTAWEAVAWLCKHGAPCSSAPNLIAGLNLPPEAPSLFSRFATRSRLAPSPPPTSPPPTSPTPTSPTEANEVTP